MRRSTDIELLIEILSEQRPLDVHEHDEEDARVELDEEDLDDLLSDCLTFLDGIEKTHDVPELLKLKARLTEVLRWTTIH